MPCRGDPCLVEVAHMHLVQMVVRKHERGQSLNSVLRACRQYLDVSIEELSTVRYYPQLADR